MTPCSGIPGSNCRTLAGLEGNDQATFAYGTRFRICVSVINARDQAGYTAISSAFDNLGTVFASALR
jgi:hypothetical protein